MKKVLFLAPCYQYTKTVITNTSRDLNKSDIPFTFSIVPRNMSIRTNNVDVTFTYDDPITWNAEMLSGIDAVYGKKELLDKFAENYFRIMPPKPGVSFIRYVKMHSDIKSQCDTTITPRTQYIPEIKNVYFNEPMTIVLWSDGTKTTVKCQDGDFYSGETGLAVAIAKKALGNKGNFNNIFKKWIPEPKETETIDRQSLASYIWSTFKEFYNDNQNKEEKTND